MIKLDWNPGQRQLRQFAFACPVGFALIGWMMSRAGAAAWWPWAGLSFGLVLLALGLARPRSLRPLYVAILTLGAPIGWLVSNLFAALFFFLVITPLGLFFRLIGRDPLALRARGMPTYWRGHRAAGDLKSYYRQG